jgi:dTDP-4-amino-4,6-dideoxygalactose transaminase
MEEQQYKSFRYLGEGHFPVASHVAHTHLYVPCHQNLSNIDVYWVIDTVQNQKGIVKKIGQPKWQLLTKQKEAQV